MSDAPAPAFAVGDVVRLKSGGMAMTIDTVRETRIACSWHSHSGDAHFADYRADMLVKEAAADVAVAKELDTSVKAFEADYENWRDRRGL